MVINSLNSTSVAFIDRTLPDLQTILPELGRLVTAIVFDPAQNGIQQMADALAGVSGLDTIHIITHGSSGKTNIGSVKLAHDSFAKCRNQLAPIGIGHAFSPTSDLLLFCGFELFKLVCAKEIAVTETHHVMATN